jgi:hypothetical protein
VLAALGAAVLLAWIAWRVLGGYRVAARGRVLARREIGALDAMADAMFPGAVLPRSGSEAGVPDYIDRLVAGSPPRQRALMRALFFLMEHGTLLFPAPNGLLGWRRLSAQPPDVRAAWLEQWRTSRLFARRLAFTSLRALLTFAYFADPAVLRRLSLEPFAIESPICCADLLYPRIGAPCGSIALGPADRTPPSDGTPLFAPDADAA